MSAAVPRTSALLEAICAEISTVLPDLRECRPHDGGIDAAEIRRWGAAAPGVYATCLAAGPAIKSASGKRVEAPLALAAYVVTRSGPNLDRGTAARAIVDRLLVLIPRARWGLAGIGDAERVRAVNRYSPAGDKTGVAVWSIEWSQTIALDLPDPDRPTVLPRELYVTFDPAQLAPGVDDNAAYDPLGHLPRETPGADR